MRRCIFYAEILMSEDKLYVLGGAIKAHKTQHYIFFSSTQSQFGLGRSPGGVCGTACGWLGGWVVVEAKGRGVIQRLSGPQPTHSLFHCSCFTIPNRKSGLAPFDTKKCDNHYGSVLI